MGTSILPFFIDHPRLSMSFFALITILILNILFLIRSVQLYINQDDYSAKKLMISSFIFLPLLQILLVVDKYF